MQYVDSNVFIYPILPDRERRKRADPAKEILIKIAEGSLPAATASLTWDEVVWIARKNLGPHKAVVEGRNLLEFPNLILLNVGESVLNRAQEFVSKYELKPRDAIHAACCVENMIKEIISDDADFDVVKEVKRVEFADLI